MQLEADGYGSDLNHLKGTFNSFLHAAVEIWVLISSAENVSPRCGSNVLPTACR